MDSAYSGQLAVKPRLPITSMMDGDAHARFHSAGGHVDTARHTLTLPASRICTFNARDLQACSRNIHHGAFLPPRQCPLCSKINDLYIAFKPAV